MRISRRSNESSYSLTIVFAICAAFVLAGLTLDLHGFTVVHKSSVIENEKLKEVTFDDSTTTTTTSTPVSPSSTTSTTSVEEMKYIHDDPKHPWNWSRSGKTDESLSMKTDCDGKSYQDLYDHFHEYGYVIFRSCTLQQKQDTVLDPVAAYTKTITEARVQDAKNKAVLDLTVDEGILEIIQFIHGGRRPFPFQTLNFSKGTQQPIHSDLVHFDTFPRTLMSAAWTALEDMNENNGPLRFFPKSHSYGIWDPDEVGLRFQMTDEEMMDGEKFSAIYGERLEQVLLDVGLEPKTAPEMKKGQTLVWAAGLAHGGSKQKDMSLTRLSQVTHYFFEGAHSYWSPRISRFSVDRINYRNLTPCFYNERIPKDKFSCAKLMIEEWKEKFKNAIKEEQQAGEQPAAAATA